MLLIELIDYLVDQNKLNQLCHDLGLPDDQDPDNTTLMYVKDELSPQVEIPTDL